MKRHDYYKLAASIGICELAGIIGSVFTAGSVSGWYVTLAKPALTPPGWIFGPVWITLYALMGIALFLVWRGGINTRQSKIAVGVFLFQLLLNALWSIIFFGLQLPGIALAEIIVLWIAIVASIIAFARVSRTAAWLLIPYLLWVSFAMYLNYGIYILN